MRNREALTWLAVSALVCSAAVAVITQAPTLAITGVNVVDVVNGRIVPNSTVVVTSDTITAVTQDGAAPAVRIHGGFRHSRIAFDW